jgi:hypothetical protein
MKSVIYKVLCLQIIENLRKKLEQKEHDLKVFSEKMKVKDELIAKQEKMLAEYQKLYSNIQFS